MKKVINFLLFSIVILSCNRKKIDESLIEGKWRFNFDHRIEIITFKEGLYSKITRDDDLIFTTKGKYFFNENIKRSEMTISLVPDLRFIKGDTVMESCQYLDLISLTDSVLIIKTRTEWNYDTGVTCINKKKRCERKKCQINVTAGYHLVFAGSSRHSEKNANDKPTSSL